MPSRFFKQPGEKWTQAIEFAGKLPTGASLQSGTISAVRLDTGATDNSVLVSTTLTISGTQALYTHQAGAHGVDYKLTALVTLSNGNLFEEDVLMLVRNQ